MQTQRNPHPSNTHQPVSKPKYQGSLHCLKVIIKEEGFGGLFKGCSALLCRDCSASAVYFLSYSVLCDWLTPDGRNKPGRYWKVSGITCQNGLFSPTLRGKPGSGQTSSSTYKTSPRSSWGVGCSACAGFGPRPSASSFTGPTLSLSSSSSSCRRGFYHTLWCLECRYEILLMWKQDN